CYETAYGLLLFGGLWILYRRRGPGKTARVWIAAVYLATYSVGRLFIGAYEVGPAAALGLRSVQLAALVGFAVGLALILSDRFGRVSPVSAPAKEQPAT